MKLSILIPLYNKEKYIQRCLESILDQQVPSDGLEIVIVDDGSKDSGPLLVQQYADGHTHITLIRQKNQGPSAARNKCMQAATGDYLYFLDADDYLAKNVLPTILGLATENNLDVLEFETKQVTEGSALDRQPQVIDNSSMEVMDGVTYVASNSFRNEAWRYIVKREFLKDREIVFIEGTLYEDTIFTASVLLAARRIAKLKWDVHRYVVVENSIVTSKDIAHNKKFIVGMVNAIEHLHHLASGLDHSHVNYSNAVKVLQGRKEDLVFALIIRTLKFRLLNVRELKVLLEKLEIFGAYPMYNEKTRLAPDQTGRDFKKIFVPIFNNKTCLLLGLRLMKAIPA